MFVAPTPKLHDTEHVRNIALVGHAGSGKTTLLETLLARTGAIHSPGSVERGSTVSDFTRQEKEQHHSLDSAVCHFDHDGVFLNILDTPGYPDFVAQALRALDDKDAQVAELASTCKARASDAFRLSGQEGEEPKRKKTADEILALTIC